MENTVRSITCELNSTLGARMTNQFYATYTHIRDGRTSQRQARDPLNRF